MTSRPFGSNNFFVTACPGHIKIAQIIEEDGIVTSHGDCIKFTFNTVEPCMENLIQCLLFFACNIESLDLKLNAGSSKFVFKNTKFGILFLE